MFFFPLLNTVTVVWVLLAAWLFVRWLRSQNVLYASLFGPTIYAIILFEPAALAIGGLLVGMIVWSLSRSVIRPVTFLRQGAVAAAAFAATYGVIRARYGFDLWSAVRLLADNAAKFNVDTLRPYDVWVRGNLLEFLVAVGVCQAVLAVAAAVDGLVASSEPIGSRFTSPPAIVTLSLAGSLLVTDLLGINRGEVVRIWIFLACACQLPAAYFCARFNRRLPFGIVLAVTLLHVALGTDMVGFILPG
jgi:methylthioxylose transferase